MRCRVLAVMMAASLMTSQAFGWGYATHARIADVLYKKAGMKNSNEIYGAMAPDMFNMAFDLPVYVPGGLYELTHYGALKVWEAARTGREKSIAFGFSSHNDEWGADFTAHHSGITHGVGQGYVIAKVDELREFLLSQDQIPALETLFPEISEAAADELYHSVIEFTIDVLTTRVDPMIGAKITEAATNRTPEFAGLIAAAFADNLGLLGEAAPAIVAYVEAEFQKSMVEYGQLLLLDEPVMVALLSEYIAGFAAGYLALWGLELPAGVDAAELIYQYMLITLELCGPDYPAELDATIEAVQVELESRGVYASSDFIR